MEFYVKPVSIESVTIYVSHFSLVKDSAASSSVLNYQWYQGVGFATFLQYMNISGAHTHIAG